MKIIYPKHSPGDLANFYNSVIVNKGDEKPVKKRLRKDTIFWLLMGLVGVVITYFIYSKAGEMNIDAIIMLIITLFSMVKYNSFDEEKEFCAKRKHIHEINEKYNNLVTAYETIEKIKRYDNEHWNIKVNSETSLAIRNREDESSFCIQIDFETDWRDEGKWYQGILDFRQLDVLFDDFSEKIICEK